MTAAPKPGWSLRAAEIAAELLREWDGHVDVEDFAARRFTKDDAETITIAIAIFDELDSVAEADDLVEMLKSFRPS